jgi:acyl-CoA dehydrogenase
MLPRTLFAEEHDSFRRTVREFIAREVTPFHAQWEKDGIVPRELWLKAGETGLLCCDVAEEFGGPGGSYLFNMIVTEEFAAAGASGPGSGFTVHSDMMATYINSFGTDERKRKWLPPMVAGRLIGAIAMTEPGAGSDLKGITTFAKREGDDYLITGQKTYISNGQLADLLVVACKTDREAGAKGMTLIVVEAARPGFSRGRRLEKIGLKAQDTSELFFDAVRVPVGNRLGAEGRGFSLLMTKLARERLSQAVRSVALVNAAIGWTIDYTRDRKAFGQSISEFQNTRFELADLAAKTAVARAYVDRCVELLLRDELDSTDAAMAKLFASELHCDAVDRCLQLHGGYGYIWDYPIARAYADARVVKIAGGSVEIMKEIIARSLFGERRR